MYILPVGCSSVKALNVVNITFNWFIFSMLDYVLCSLNDIDLCSAAMYVQGKSLLPKTLCSEGLLKLNGMRLKLISTFGIWEFIQNPCNL